MNRRGFLRGILAAACIPAAAQMARVLPVTMGAPDLVIVRESVEQVMMQRLQAAFVVTQEIMGRNIMERGTFEDVSGGLGDLLR